MKRTIDKICIILFACCVLTGCYPSVSNLAPQSPDLPWQSTVDEECECNASKNFALPPHCVPPYQSAEELIDPEYVYNLAELIDLAQRNNPKTRIAWEQARQAAYAVGLSLATFLPQISIDALVGYQHLAIPLPKFVSPTGKIYIDLAETLPSFVIEWLLFDFGKRDCELESAKYTSYASNVAFTEAHQQLIFDIVKAYFDFSAARTQLHVAEGALKNTEIVQDAAESRQIRGLEKTTEVAIARRETAKARFNLEKAKADNNDAYYALLEAMGLTPTLRIQIADDSDRSLPRNLAADVNTYISRALEMRPDIIEAFAKLNAGKADVCSAKKSFLPTFNLDGFAFQNISSVGTKHSTVSGVNSPATAIFIEFQWPLYDGGTRQNKLNIARSKRDAAKETLRQTQDAAIRQVAKAYDMVKSALAEYDSALALVNAADIAFDAALDSYRQGVGTFTDTVSTNTEKINAQSTLAQAYSSALTSAAALAFSTGELTSIDALDHPSPCIFNETIPKHL